MKTKLKILEVKLEHKVDELPDTSHWGEYSRTSSSKYSIDRKERGDMGRGEFQFFNPSSNYIKKDDSLCDGITEKDVERYVQEDYRRMENLNTGQWHYIGIIAKAEIWNPVSHVTQVIRSGGLWGIESDSGDDCLKDVASEELANLKTELLALGIGERAIARAFSKLD